MDTSTLNYSLIHPGSMIGYRLLPSQLPVHPRKIWLGKVIRLHTPTLFTVEIIEPGYYGLQEYVCVEQIVAVSDGG